MNRALSRLDGLNVLVVEDTMMIAVMLQDILVSQGCKVLVATRLGPAMEVAEGRRIDGALLDVNLPGVRVYPIADALTRRRIPYIFVTGYSQLTIDERYRKRPTLQKPFQPERLKQMMVETFVNRSQ